MAEPKTPRSKAPDADPDKVYEQRVPPSGGSGVKPAPVPADPSFDKLMAALAPILAKVEAVIVAKASSYTDARVMIDTQRSDRQFLMTKLAEIIEDEPALVKTDGGPTEEQLVEAYRNAFNSKGVFLLPNVVQVFPADAGGTTVIEVEFALADHEGRLWPACCRVAGAGNDRVAHARGGSGDKGMSRAMSAAWKEAMCRLLMIPRGHDPEAHDLAHEAPIGVSRPSNQQQRQQREQPLTLAQEEDVRERIIAKINDASEIAALDALMQHDGTKRYLARIGTRSRTLIEQAERDQRKGLRIAEERYRRDRQPETRFDRAPPDEGPDEGIGDDVGGDERRESDERGDRPPGGFDDDDIPF